MSIVFSSSSGCFIPKAGAMVAHVVTHLPPTSEVGGSNPGLYMGKLIVSYRWSAVYRQNLDQLDVLISSAHKTTHRDMTCTVLKVT